MNNPAALDDLALRGEQACFFPDKSETDAGQTTLRASAKNVVPSSTAHTDPLPDEEMECFHKVVPSEYHDFADVFSKEEAKVMPPHRPYDHPIDLDPDTTPPHGPIYSMSENELVVLREYLDDMVSKGFIRSSNSPAGAPVLFVKKKDGSLRLCVDYRGLNKITKKNRYPLPLIGNLLDRLKSATVYSKIDLRAGYHNVRIASGHEWKTAFRTRYGSFEYLVMPFGLTNAPATFQYFMNDIFRDMVDICVVVYLDDILIYSENMEQHRQHVRKVLERLRQHNLHAKPEKCMFHASEAEFLGFMVSPAGVTMAENKTQAIQAWPAPTTVKEVQSFLGFANFYRRFIDNYSAITVPLTRLTRKDVPFVWSDICAQAFKELKAAFTRAPVLSHFNPDFPIVVETDASDYAIAGILSQISPVDGDIHPVAFHSRSLQQAELNYEIYDKELLAIFDAFKT
jgi:hypothetical protein